jgi:hypothetical protein
VVRWKQTDNWEECIAFIFRVDEEAKQGTISVCLLLQAGILLPLVGDTEDEGGFAPPKRPLNSNGLHDFLFQKIKLSKNV